MKKSVAQRHNYGCGAACLSFVADIPYDEVVRKLGKRKADQQGYYCKELVIVLQKLDPTYAYKYLKPKLKGVIYHEGVIVYIKRSKRYLSGHYLVRHQNFWMDPWINFLDNQRISEAKSGFRQRLPGKPIYAIFPSTAKNITMRKLYLMKSSTKLIQVCAFCGIRKSDRTGHIISRNLFANTSSVNFDGYTAPACKECETGYLKDEEFFRNIITKLGYEGSENARELFHSKIVRSITRKPALAISEFEQMELVDLYTPSGIWIGRRTKITLQPRDKKRIENILVRYTKGLFNKHFGTPIPEDFDIKVAWPEQMKEVINTAGKIKPLAKFGDVLTYGYGHVENTYNSAWLFLFYEKTPFLVFVVNDDVKSFKSSNSIPDPRASN